MIRLLWALMVTIILLISTIFSIVYCDHAVWGGVWPWIWPEPWANYVFKYLNVEEDIVLIEISSWSYSTLVLFVGCWVGFRIARSRRPPL